MILLYELTDLLYHTLILKVLSNILRKRLYNFSIENLEKIQIAPTYGYRNQRCHWNAYNEYLMNTECVEVIAVVTISKTDFKPYIHFINYQNISDFYFDITLGSSGMCYFDYYMIGFCDLSIEYIENMDNKLTELKYWAIDRCFDNKLVRALYKKLQDKYEII